MALVVVFGALDAPQGLTQPSRPIFVFDRPFWINLHQFLYVLGRAHAKTPDSERRAVSGAPADEAGRLALLSDADRQSWQRAVTEYAAGLSRKDAVFDEPLVALEKQLVALGESPTVNDSGIPQLAATLSRVAPIYRRAWWPAHDEANRVRVEQLTALLASQGRPILDYITRAYREPWPASGYPVHIAAYANWAGAFSTDAGILIVSSTDPALEGLRGLEIIFHEAMHQWDSVVNAALTAEARRQGVRVPPNLSHALIFFTAGQAVHAIDPTYVPYAEAEGVWSRGLGSLKAAAETAWGPYLAGAGTRDEAIERLIRAAAASRK
jgi:hypothetical protein